MEKLDFEKIKRMDMLERYKATKEWIDTLKLKLETTTYENKDLPDLHMFDYQLHSDPMDDQIEISLDNNEFPVVIGLYESLHETTDMRDENIEFIKLFIRNEMPWLKIAKVIEWDSGSCGFSIYCELTDGNDSTTGM
jgi:hypothetical protein